MTAAESASALSRLEQRAEALACQNVDSMTELSSSMTDPRRQALGVGAAIAGLAALHWAVPSSYLYLHSFLQHLNFLPIVLAGLLFGWRGATLSTAAAFAMQAPHIWLSWGPLSFYATDVLLELPVFGLAGAITGHLAERERRQRTNLETTKQELEEVYHELQQNFERLKRAERLYAAGQLSAGMAHEIRNPLASITGAVGILKRGHGSIENCRECLDIIEKETQRLNRLLTSFLDFARPRAPKFQPVQLPDVFDSVISLAHHAAGATTIELRQSIAGPLPEVRCDAEQIKQVLLNLIINSIQAARGPGVVELRAREVDGFIQISVHDEGCGMAQQELDRMFDPFFTTKENGTGLGLAVAAKIIEQHGGNLSGANNRDQGMTFTVDLPLKAVPKT
ncbi:sensor histidine kinase [Paludibaculum fermentans]|uniref:sensor histidine kinase n=1 Tax=Paludibaculum fermentans TaxID=1473598 RepID=UPI003EC08ABF